MEANVTIDEQKQQFAIEGDGTTFTQSFDGVQDEIERISIELVGRDVFDVEKLDDPHMPQRGTMAAWDHLQNIRGLLRDACSRQGEAAVAGLSPQLGGLEGQWVEVIDEPGDEPRRFIVGQSTGWMPTHLESTTKDLDGARTARIEYHEVREVEDAP